AVGSLDTHDSLTLGSLWRLAGVVRVFALAGEPLHRGHRCMHGDCRTDGSGRHHADLVGVLLDAELLDVGETVVERTLVPESVFRAADAAMARLDREGNAAIPAHGRAGVVGGRAFAAHLVETIALARRLVVPLLDELAGVEMRPPVALVVDALRVKHLWPALTVELGQFAESGDEGDGASHHFGDRGASRHLDNRLVGD